MTNLLADLELPSTDREEWRYSRIGELPLGDLLSEPPAPPPEVPEPLRSLAGRSADRAATVLVADGSVVDVEHGDGAVRVERRADSLRIASDEGDPFVAAHHGRDTDTVVLEVPAGAVLDAPVVVARWIGRDGTVAWPRIVVRAGADSEVRIVEWSSSADVVALDVPLVELEVGPAARVRYLAVQELGPRVWQVGRTAATVGQDSTLQLGHAAFGGTYARQRFDCGLDGRGASGGIAAVYLGAGEQMHDLRTFQQHLAPDTRSDLAFKGTVDDRSHAVYTGLIRITKEGRGSNATQSNRIVKLSPEAWAESVPNLEIEQNDVRCSHASAVGPIDPDQRFYLESRGVPPPVTERLVVNGFFADVLALLAAGDAAVEDSLRRAVAAKLGAGA